MITRSTLFICSLISLLFFLSSTAQAKGNAFGSKLCQQVGYSCYTVQPGDSWQSLWPDAIQRDIVMHANRMNTPLRAGKTLAVPDHLDTINKMEIAPFPASIPAPGIKRIVFDQKEQAIGVYNPEGILINWAPASGGKNWCADVQRPCRTIKGTYTFYRMGNANCKSSKYPVNKGGAPMPYCMFFHRGFAIHGSSTVPGYNASHGCVRTFTEEAKWLNEEFVTLGGTTGDGLTEITIQ